MVVARVAHPKIRDETLDDRLAFLSCEAKHQSGGKAMRKPKPGTMRQAGGVKIIGRSFS